MLKQDLLERNDLIKHSKNVFDTSIEQTGE